MDRKDKRTNAEVIERAIIQWLDDTNPWMNCYIWIPWIALIKFIICIQLGLVDKNRYVEDDDYEFAVDRDREKDENEGKSDEYGYQYTRIPAYYLSKKKWIVTKGYRITRD